jgi:hypothetical protein
MGKTNTYQKRLSFQFNIAYFIATIIIFLIEVFIAIFVQDNFIRPYLGDVLVVILMYTAIKSMIRIKEPSLFPVFLFAFAVFVELLQLVGFVNLFGLEENKLARIVLGSVYDIKDIICYGVGSVFLIMWEMKSLIANNTR